VGHHLEEFSVNTTPSISVIIPAFEEGESVVAGLINLSREIQQPNEILVIVDNPIDSTVAPVNKLSEEHPAIRLVVNTYGSGPANAIRYGIDQAIANVVVVTMADGCDDPRQVEELAHLVKRGVVIASASRYMPGGQQVGGPRIKRILSRVAGKSFALITGVGTHDATNSFKAYDKNFVEKVGIHSRHGFEIGLELTAKARRLGLSVAEIPTTWIDRTFGKSNFRLAKWLPKYFGWYLFGLGFPHPDSKIRALIKNAEN
jgi:cellulose synthase/poly-beta-1,6-N-acetylglucosamine synthase-like glycosyltransferase